MDKKEYQRQYIEKNREKIKQQRREYYALNKDRIQELKKVAYDPEKQRDTRLRKTYGISSEDYDKLAEKQEYCCSCCGVHQDNLKNSNNQFGQKKLVVDHCHTTGVVRNLLCSRCNTVIGMLEEDPNVLLKVEKYLERCIATKERIKGHS